MRPLLLASASVAALFIASQASAADLAVKARPMMVPAPVYSWTGCYVGGHVGWGWGHQRHNQAVAFSGSSGGTSVANASGKVDSSGGLFGAQVGCNYQFSGNWVVGVQGDIAGTGINGRNGDPGTELPIARLSEFQGTIGIKSDWLASATIRLGMTAFDNRSLFYVKGGGAWIHNRWDLHDTFIFYDPTQVSETRAGWTAGVGWEYMMTQNWTVFVEGNYYDFGNGKLLAFAPGIDVTFSSGKQTVETVKIGVNYKFGGDAPVVARY
jgi:outer membrane immunogenic protein